MEYIHGKIIPFTKFENLNIYIKTRGCAWNYCVNFFMVYDINIHQLNLGNFRILKCLDENLFLKCFFSF
jgi:hypothetical protein